MNKKKGVKVSIINKIPYSLNKYKINYKLNLINIKI